MVALRARTLPAVLAAVTAAGSTSTGCGSACEIPCVSRADVYFDEALAAAGRYQLEVVTTEGPFAVCEATVPSSKDDGCGGAGAAWIVSEAVNGVSVSGVHELVELHLYRDAKVIGNAALHPRYRDLGAQGATPSACGSCSVAVERAPLP